MEKKYFDFDNIRDREDFYIALVVLAFFGWLLWQFGFKPMDKLPDTVAEVVAVEVIDENVEVLDRSDRDGDGVLDVNDKCPDAFGYELYNGCGKEPKMKAAAAAGAGVVAAKAVDSDGDGIMDKKDRCPSVRGVAPTGCPADADKDGIADAQDRCPQVPGIAANGGCPADADKDGVPDNVDKCPNQRGSKQYAGCPPPADADKDGVADKDDKCPRLKGTAANGGCPPDSDGDGVYDAQDKCPNERGVASNKGCPEVKLEAAEQKLLQEVTKGVQFETASANLKGTSNRVLNQLSNLMKKYPNSSLTIAGHTDSQGDAEKNLKLSGDRANACLEFLKNKGIAANRMNARGYGQTQPKATNDTPQGRRTNRRVEFTLK